MNMYSGGDILKSFKNIFNQLLYKITKVGMTRLLLQNQFWLAEVGHKIIIMYLQFFYYITTIPILKEFFALDSCLVLGKHTIGPQA